MWSLGPIQFIQGDLTSRSLTQLYHRAPLPAQPYTKVPGLGCNVSQKPPFSPPILHCNSLRGRRWSTPQSGHSHPPVSTTQSWGLSASLALGPGERKWIPSGFTCTQVSHLLCGVALGRVTPAHRAMLSAQLCPSEACHKAPVPGCMCAAAVLAAVSCQNLSLKVAVIGE